MIVSGKPSGHNWWRIRVGCLLRLPTSFIPQGKANSQIKKQQKETLYLSSSSSAGSTTSHAEQRKTQTDDLNLNIIVSDLFNCDLYLNCIFYTQEFLEWVNDMSLIDMLIWGMFSKFHKIEMKESRYNKMYSKYNILRYISWWSCKINVKQIKKDILSIMTHLTASLPINEILI